MAHQRVHATGRSIPGTEIERQLLEQIKQLELSTIPDLKLKWRELKGQAPPQFAKRSFLTQVIAWELQAKAFGGIEPPLHRLLLGFGSGQPRPTSSDEDPVPQKFGLGVKLIRIWKGEAHQVIVTDEGFLWKDKTFKSLSIIARQITGTQWSGPVFFGLKKTKSKSAPKLLADRIPLKVGVAVPGVSTHG
jgi:hypothetical protein